MAGSADAIAACVRRYASLGENATFSRMQMLSSFAALHCISIAVRSAWPLLTFTTRLPKAMPTR
eukprot:7384311-Prymnesium_polylepis.2